MRSVRLAAGWPVATLTASRWPRSHGVRTDRVRSRIAGGGSCYVHPRLVGSYATRPPLCRFTYSDLAPPLCHPPHGVIFFPFAVIYFHPGALVLPGVSGCYTSGLQVINFMYGYVSPLNSKSVRSVCIIYPN